MMCTQISTYVLALIKITVVHIFLHAFGHRWHSNSWVALDVVKGVSICDILGVNVSSSFDHWKLLSIQVLVRV